MSDHSRFPEISNKKARFEAAGCTFLGKHVFVVSFATVFALGARHVIRAGNVILEGLTYTGIQPYHVHWLDGDD
jgi:hypothetical protein